MTINKISGNILQDNLQRGANLSIQGNLVYVDVVDTRVGINTSATTHTFNVVGNAHIDGIQLQGNAISADSGIVELGSNANISITGGSNLDLLSTDGTGNLSWVAVNEAVLGNIIDLGTPSLGNLISNAVTLTTTTTVTDGIAQLNVILGKLVPAAPPNFPNGTTLSITTATSSGRMTTGFTQTDNTPGANKAVAAGTVVSVVRGSTYSTNTISNTGPGDSGTLTVFLNGVDRGNVTFNTGANPTANGTHGNLVVTNNYDYHVANASIASGFWYVFSTSATGTVTQGWNEVYLDHSEANSTNTPYWYYDSSAPGTPVFSNASVTACASPSLT
jgi:hypothetical protein